MSEQTEEQLEIEIPEPQEYHPILEVWLAILAPVRTVRKERVSPKWATTLVQTYPEVRFRDMPEFNERYYDLLEEMLLRLETTITDNPEALHVRNAEEDVQENSTHYFNLILDWQLILLERELSWNPASDTAAIDLAAMTEVYRIVFEPKGILDMLDQIKFELTDDTRDLITQALNDYSANRSEVE